ncbi:MAG: tyrosine-type recombinase/integrase [Candidatus Pelagibacterales bacterium]
MTENQSFQLDQIDLFNGQLKIFKTSSSDYYYMKVSIPGSNNGFRKSLKTRDESLARQLAEKEYLAIRYKIDQGISVFDPKLSDLEEAFLKEKQIDLDNGIITKGRLNTIKSQINHLKRFVGKYYDSALAKNYTGDDFKSYYNFRRKHNPEVNNTTLINEASTIKAIYWHAIERGSLPLAAKPRFPNMRKSTNKREALTMAQLSTITRHMRTKEFLDFDKSNHRHYFIRDFVGLLSNTGIRFGEARRLRWHNVKIIRKPENNKHKWACEIYLSDDMTKNKKERLIQGRGGVYLDRIKSYSKYTKPNDYIFVDQHSGQELHRDYYYRAWDKMLVATDLIKSNTPITYYNLRHSYATFRLYAGVDPYILAKNMGTGLTFLENHYGQPKTRLLRKELTKDIDKELKELLRDE